MKINYKKILIVIISIISVILIYKLPRLLINKYEELPEVKLKEKIDKNKSFAIMISEDGNNYQEYESNEWPNDKYNFKKAECVDNNGDLINDVITFENGKATIKTDKTIYCTLYFDHKETIEILRENDINKVLSEDTQGGMYRYQGTNNDVNNYVCLNEECISSNRYRIIGINDNSEIKLIKEESAGQISYGNSNDIEVLWPDSLIYKVLNTNEDSFYNNLSNNIKEMILEKDWSYPIIDYTTYISASKDLNLLYKIENGLSESQFEFKVPLSEEGKDGVICKTATLNEGHLNEKMCYVLKKEMAKSIRSNIGIMYLHDYYYSVQKDGLNCSYLSNNAENCKTSWLYNNISEWLISGRSFASDSGNYSNYAIDSARDSLTNSKLYTWKFSYRPIFYLKNNLKITKGNGTKENPFIINFV